MYWGARGRRESPGLRPPAGQGWIWTQARPCWTHSPLHLPLQRCPPEEHGAMLRWAPPPLGLPRYRHPLAPSFPTLGPSSPGSPFLPLPSPLSLQGRSGSRGRRAEPGPGFGHATAAGGAAVPGPGPRPAARRRGVQPAAGVGLRHGRLHREPGEAPGRSVVGLEEGRASSFCHLHGIVTPTPP